MKTRFMAALACLMLVTLPFLAVAQIPLEPLTAENAELMGRVGRIPQPNRWQMLSLAWSPDGAHLAMTTHTGVSVTDFEAGGMRPGKHYSDMSVDCATYSPDGKLLAACNNFDGMIFIWNAATGEQVATINSGNYGADGLEFSPDGTLLAVRNGFNKDEEVTLWGVWSNNQRQPFTASNAYRVQKLATFALSVPAIDMSFNADGSLLATIGASDDMLRVWDTKSEEMVADRQLDEVYAADFSPDGRYLAVSVNYSDIVLLDASTFEEVRTMHNTVSTIDVTDLTFSPDSTLLALSSSDGLVQVWDVASGGLLNTLSGHPYIVWRLAFNPAGTLLASLGWSDGIRLWGRGSDLTMLAAPTATPAPTLTPTPIPVLTIGGYAHIQTTDGDVLNMRNSPSRQGELVAKLDSGTPVSILEGPQEGDGLIWWKVRTEDGLEGWVVESVDGEQTLIAAN